jgi:hypothetical protein
MKGSRCTLILHLRFEADLAFLFKLLKDDNELEIGGISRCDDV